MIGGRDMLLKFRVKNYRSIKQEAVLDLEAVGLNDQRECLLKHKRKSYLPVISIYGKNGGGKSNLIRAFWLAVQFIRNAQRTQYESAEVPVRPFELDDISKKTPTEFHFEYISNDIKYWYGFSATKEKIVTEYLYAAPKGQKSEIFTREYQNFHFPSNKEKSMKELIKQAVATNQLFFAISCVMNYEPCIKAMQWFRKEIFFSRDYSDLGQNILSHREDKELLQSIIQIAKVADFGISDMKFEINNTEISNLEELPEFVTEQQRQEIEKAIEQFRKSLSADAESSEGILQFNELKATSYHKGKDSQGNIQEYALPLSEESDGTIRLMSRAAAIQDTLKVGGVLIVDEIENRLHPLLVQYIIEKFQNQSDGQRAQLIFTTHSTDIMNRGMLRRDQYYFVDKDNMTGESELYSLADFSVRLEENIAKAYLLGKYGAVPYIDEE